MADLDIKRKSEELENGEKVVTISINGVVDGATFSTYEENMELLTSMGEPNLILDFSKCIYINSAGLGQLVVLARRVSEEGGRMYLGGLSSNVRDTLWLLGLQAVFEVYDSREECLTAIRDRRLAEAEKTDYPLKTKCKACGTQLVIKEAGTYQCPTCMRYLSAEESGRVLAYRPLESERAICHLPTDFAWRDTLIDGVRTLAERGELSKKETEELSLAADDIWSFIAKRRSDKNEICEILLLGGKRHIVVGFSLHNRMIVEEDTPQYSLLMRSLSAHVDDVQVKPGASEGQVIRISKTGAKSQSGSKK
jgi:anti-anti-sigma factor